MVSFWEGLAVAAGIVGAIVLVFFFLGPRE
jgi:hypothetical protein